MSWHQTLRGIVQPWECDDNGHLSVRYYIPKFDDSSYLLLFDAGLRMPELRPRGLALVSASHRLRYVAELPKECTFAIEGKVIRVGRSSIRSAQRMINRDSGAVVATCLGVDALFDLAARRSAPWPDDIRPGLEAAVASLSEAEAAVFKV